MFEREFSSRNFKSNPEPFWKFKNIEAVIQDLLVNKNIFLSGAVNIEEAKAFIQVLDHFVPHRELVETLEPDFKPSNSGQVVILATMNQKDLEKKNFTVVYLDKKKVSGKGSNYAKSLIKRLQNFKTFDEIKKEMNQEIFMILDLVGKLVSTVELNDNDLIKKKIDDLIFNLTNKEIFDVVKELAISYNPILKSFISEKAVYTLRSDLWNI